MPKVKVYKNMENGDTMTVCKKDEDIMRDVGILGDFTDMGLSHSGACDVCKSVKDGIRASLERIA